MIFGFYNHQSTNLQGWLLIQVQLLEALLRLSLNGEQGQLIFAGWIEWRGRLFRF